MKPATDQPVGRPIGPVSGLKDISGRTYIKVFRNKRVSLLQIFVAFRKNKKKFHGGRHLFFVPLNLTHDSFKN